MEYLEEYEFLRPYLQNGEYVVWKGRPGRGNLFSGRDAMLLPFGIVWLAFFVFWESMVISSGGGAIMAVFGIPFILIGIYLVFGRFVQKARVKARTFYAVTNKRIIIKSGDKIEMYNAGDLPPMSVKVHKNGNGMIFFGGEIYTRRMNSYGMYSSYFALEDLPDYLNAQNAINMMEKDAQ